MFFIMYAAVLGIIGFVVVNLVKSHIDLNAAGKQARKGFPENSNFQHFAHNTNNFAANQMHRQAMDMHHQAVNMHNQMHNHAMNMHQQAVDMHTINSFHNHMM